jgi:RNA polymerase sigma factor (sigma-70 family)
MKAKRQPVRKSATRNRIPKKQAKVAAVQAPKPLSYDELILNHRENGRKLARSILRRWQVNMPAEEVDSIVDLTLCEAAVRYDVNKGASFITFLFYHLRGRLVRAVASATSDSQLFLAVAQSAGLDVSDWTTANEDTAVGILPDFNIERQTEVESPEALLIKKEKTSLCQTAVYKLDELEREIIDRSYCQDEPLVDIAKLLGYSRCHISRVKKRALDRIRGIIGEVSVDYLAEISNEVNDDDFTERESSQPKRNRRRRIEIKPSMKAAA